MKWKNLILIPLVGLLLLGSMQTVLAEEVVTASIPVSVQIKGGAEDIARLSGEPFSLSLMDDAGEILDTKEVTPDRTTGKGNAEFQVRLDQPKDFTFYVFQNPSKNLPEYWTEPTEYRVDVHVVYDAEGNLTAPIRAYKRTAAEEEMETDDLWTKAGEIVFENSLYAPCLIDPPLEKKVLDETTNTYVEDRTGQFTFVMEPYDEKGDAAKIAATPMPDGKTGGSVELTITGTTSPAPDKPELGPEFPQFQDSTGKSTDMGIIRYYEAGEWDYQIYEKSASPAAGYEKDDEVYYVHVSVTLDEANKTYVAERTYYSKKTGQEVRTAFFGFVNKLHRVKPVSVNPQVEKEVYDADNTKVTDTTGTFTYQLAPGGNAPMPEGYSDLTITGSTIRSGSGDTLTVTDAKGNPTKLGALTFTAPGTYTYTVKETAHSDGYSDDATTYTIQIEVRLNQDTWALEAVMRVNGTAVNPNSPLLFKTVKPASPKPAPAEESSSSAEESSSSTEESTGGGGTNGGGGNSGGGSSGGGSSRGGSSRSETSGGGPAASADTTPAGDVLGAVRDAAESIGNGVLGAARDPVGSVLGAARAAKTGDYSLMIGWLIAMLLAVGGIFAWTRFFLKLRRNGRS